MSPRTGHATDVIERRVLRVTGVVQGVGFRPYVYRLAGELGLVGFVGNDAVGVFVEVEGDAATLDTFVGRLADEAPRLARVDSIESTTIGPTGGTEFTIVESVDADGPRTLVPPDVATCPACLADLRDPADRRYRYPFTNCTDCGPRFTIIRDLPYDRLATTMAGFAMCPDCAREYRDPNDRRYHAQPVACPACGPQLRFERSGAAATSGTDAVLSAVHAALAAGEVVAIKGLGGYHLACDATDDASVVRLRERKGRVDKPFAVMVRDLESARAIAVLGDVEEAVLAGAARPIVLVRRRPDGAVAPGVAPGNPLIGVMLPYTPLHHLLFEPVPGAHVAPPTVIVLTSGNRSDEPICFDDADARSRLDALADAFCTHDRPIEVPCDDSVVRVIDGEVQPIRRSRGYAPLPVSLPVEVRPVVGVGGELKNTCCVASGRQAWVGQHVGDMENLETLEAFEASVTAFTRMYRVEPEAYGVDLHPGYLTRRWAVDRFARGGVDRIARGGVDRIVDVQHHHAHVAALMAEHGLDGSARLLGVAFDGTGFGTAADGTTQIWGGEVLLADYDGFERVGHLVPLPLPGGDGGVRNPCRIAVAYLTALGIDVDPRVPSVAACDPTELAVTVRQVERGVGCVPTTSMGRLFDVIASLLGVRHRVTYEAQAAIELEVLAEQGVPDRAHLRFGLDADGAIDPGPLLTDLVASVLDGNETADLALAFHVAVADAIRTVADRARATGYAGPVGLTGGVFQNSLLTRLARRALDDAGFTVLMHRVVPPNDGGLALGQAVIAGSSHHVEQPDVERLHVDGLRTGPRHRRAGGKD